jgi:hypothetical protein
VVLIGRTPPEVEGGRKAELKALEELEGDTSNDGSDRSNGANGRVNSEKGVAASSRHHQPR